MQFRALIAALALTAFASADAEAGPFRRHARPTPQSAPQPAYQPQAPTPAGVVPAGSIANCQTPAVTPTAEHAGGPALAVPPAATVAGFPATGLAPAGGAAGDGLDEVNAKRAARGLRPFARDEGLTQAALACARFRAASGLFGHTANDFAFVPPGSVARSAGCAAYPAGYGWMSCCVYDGYTYGGAAWVTGGDGRRYMHLFVR